MKRLSNKELAAATAASEAALRDALAKLGRRTTFKPAAEPAKMAGGVAPIAAALVTAGLAWLAVNRTTSTDRGQPDPEDLMDWEDEGGLPVEAGEIEPAKDEWLANAMAARDRAEARLAALYEQGRETAVEKARIASVLAEDLAMAFRHGLSDLGEDAAERVAEARAQAWAALDQGKAIATGGWSKGSAAVRQHPIAASAIGVAVGATVAAVFPRTRPMMKVAAPLAAAALLARAANVLVQGRETGGGIPEPEGQKKKAAADANDELAPKARPKPRPKAKRTKSANSARSASKKPAARHMNGAAAG